jgi:hypothetical protein
MEFHNAELFTLGYRSTYDFLPEAFPIAPGVRLRQGEYRFETARIGYNFGQQRRIASNVLAEYGTFYDGHRTAVTFTQGRWRLSYRLSIQPTYSLNHVDVSAGTFSTHLTGSRVTFTMTPQMFASALLQYNSTTHSVAANVRLRWEYRPGSELFVVLNEQRDTASRHFPDLANRALIVKVTRLLRF